MTALELRAALQAEVLGWLGTPYHHCAGIRGHGVDCLMLLVRVFAAVGCVPATFDPRPYAPQWHLHRGEELYLQGLERYLHPLASGEGGCSGRQLAAHAVDAGDVLLWRFGRTFSHAAMVVRSVSGELEVVHALADAREVTVQRPDDAPMAGRPWHAFTLIKPWGGA